MEYQDSQTFSKSHLNKVSFYPKILKVPKFPDRQVLAQHTSSCFHREGGRALGYDQFYLGY